MAAIQKLIGSMDFQQCKIYSIIFCTQNTSSYERKNMRAMSIPVLGMTLWNSLNASLVSIMSKYMFKRRYVNILVSKYIM